MEERDREVYARQPQTEEETCLREVPTSPENNEREV